ncbi:MAG: 50S ribosomal protein L13 [Patescibacteria group bacterium]
MDYVIDAKDKRLGRIASEAALILQGKKSAGYAPNKVGDDRVLFKNVELLTVSGDKWDSKIYYRHTGYMGHLKELTLKQAFTRDPKKVLRETIRHMLPKNFLNQKRLKNIVFVADEAVKGK